MYIYNIYIYNCVIHNICIAVAIFSVVFWHYTQTLFEHMISSSLRKTLIIRFRSIPKTNTASGYNGGGHHTAYHLQSRCISFVWITDYRVYLIPSHCHIIININIFGFRILFATSDYYSPSIRKRSIYCYLKLPVDERSILVYGLVIYHIFLQYVLKFNFDYWRWYSAIIKYLYTHTFRLY